jgi:hypothetical protein
MDLVKDWLKLYYDKDMSAGFARELWAKVSLPGKSYIKAGHMLLPYGYRLMDDQAFVRAVTGYTYNTSALGYEVGVEPGPLSLIANVTAGTKDEPGLLSSVGSLVFSNMPVVRTFRLGGSYSMSLKEKTRKANGSYGAFGGASFGMFTVLAQRDYTKKDSVKMVEDYVEADFLPVQGFNVKGVYETYWPNRDIPAANNLQRRITVGIEPFVTQFLQLGLYYRMNDWIPQTTMGNQDNIIGRVHVFF